MTTLNEIKPATPAEGLDGGRCAVADGSASVVANKLADNLAPTWHEAAALIHFNQKLIAEITRVREVAREALLVARQIKPSYESRRAAIDLALEKLSSPNTQVTNAGAKTEN